MTQPPRPSDHDLTNASRLLPNGDLLPNGVVVSEPSFRDRVIMRLIATGEQADGLALSGSEEELISSLFESGIDARDATYAVISHRADARDADAHRGADEP